MPTCTRALMAAAALLVLTGTGCSAAHTSTGSTGSTEAKGVISAAPSATSLSRADFVTKADALCSRYHAKIDALVAPTADDDFVIMSNYFTQSVAIFDSFAAELRPLIEQSPDRATLDTQWLSIDKSDVGSAKPLIKKFSAAVKANNVRAVQQAMAKLDALPDHSDTITAFLKGYGLAACASLESA